MFNDLQKYGWNSDFENKFQQSVSKLGKTDLIPGRVLSVHRTNYDVMTNDGEIVCEITGNRLKDTDPYQKPLVGDWVVIETGEGDNANIIVDIFERKTILERRKVHSDVEVQLIAGNVDMAVLVQSLANDFNIARIERVLVQIAQAGIKPLIILNKMDIAENIDQVREDMKRIDASIPVIYSSFTTGEGLDIIETFLQPGETIIFIGSSGVGKSSIINTMLDDTEQQKTKEVSDYSGKGKHTTTARKLFVLDTGVIVIDTPGTREFGLTGEDTEALKENFTQIETLAGQCKFRDCKHNTEPDCMVREALENGELDRNLFENYQKLEKEINT